MEWISVEDRLPEDIEFVLVYQDEAMACRGWNPTARWFEDWQGCTMAGVEIDLITHWMPLPGPPEGCL